MMTASSNYPDLPEHKESPPRVRSEALKEIGILVGPTGRGSNMSAIAKACADGSLDAQVSIVIAPRETTPAKSLAQALGIPTAVVPYGEDYPARLLDALAQVQIVCLAGYLKLLPLDVIAAFSGHVLNIHPALLPKFGGKGMYGHFVHEAVIAAGETESGCTVHRVTGAYDEGQVLVQMRCPVLPDDSPDTLAARVLELEHRAYPEAIRHVLAETI
jgi:formyltetrahydrofolate-dependent phosphoribosylglycinamide formyltransferase